MVSCLFELVIVWFSYGVSTMLMLSVTASVILVVGASRLVRMMVVAAVM